MTGLFAGGAAYTNPSTTDTQNTALGGRTHSQFHADLADDMEAIHANGSVTQRTAAVVGSTDPTIISGTTTALANPTKTITTTGGDVFLFARMTVSTTGSDSIGMYARVDSGAWTLIADVYPDSSGRWATSGFHLFTGLSSASHTFDLGWSNSGGVTATSYGAARRLMVIEVKR